MGGFGDEDAFEGGEDGFDAEDAAGADVEAVDGFFCCGIGEGVPVAGDLVGTEAFGGGSVDVCDVFEEA